MFSHCNFPCHKFQDLKEGSSISFLWLLQQITTKLPSYNKRILFQLQRPETYSQSDTSKVTLSPKLWGTPSLLVASGMTWLVIAQLQPLPLWSHRCLLFCLSVSRWEIRRRADLSTKVHVVVPRVHPNNSAWASSLRVFNHKPDDLSPEWGNSHHMRGLGLEHIFLGTQLNPLQE